MAMKLHAANECLPISDQLCVLCYYSNGMTISVPISEISNRLKISSRGYLQTRYPIRYLPRDNEI